MGLSTWMNGSNARRSSGDMPMTKPSGIATKQARPNPSATRPSECASWMAMPLALAPGSLPIILAYSICSAVMPAVLLPAPEEAVATYQIPSRARKMSTDNRPARRLRFLAGVMSCRLADGEALGVLARLGGIEFAPHDLELGVRAFGHLLVQRLHLLFRIGDEEHLFGNLFVVHIALDVAPALHLREH